MSNINSTPCLNLKIFVNIVYKIFPIISAYRLLIAAQGTLHFFISLNRKLFFIHHLLNSCQCKQNSDDALPLQRDGKQF